MSRLCCEALEKEVIELRPPTGGGLLYPKSMRPKGQIEQMEDGSWAINGCCGGGCFVITDMKHCPFCGIKLPTELEYVS